MLIYFFLLFGAVLIIFLMILTKLSEMGKELEVFKARLDQLERSPAKEADRPAKDGQRPTAAAKPGGLDSSPPPLPTPEPVSHQATDSASLSTPSPQEEKAERLRSALKGVDSVPLTSPGAPQKTSSPDTAEAPVNSEKSNGDWFGKVAIWIGGIALLMAGFFLIRFSLESGLLTPTVRLILSSIFGAVLCASGTFFSGRFNLHGNERVGQALSGAGVGTLYFAAYAAVHLHGLVGPAAGFAWMAAITVLAVGLSLRNGAPIALLGLSGGFLTPYLMAGESADTRLLLTYLFFLYVGSMVLCSRRNWPALSLFSLVACYLWSILVIIQIAGGQSIPSLHVALFILGLAAVNLIPRLMISEGETEESNFINRAITLGSASLVFGVGLIQLFALAFLRGFSWVETSTFAILALGAWTLALIRDREFSWGAGMAVSALAVLTLFHPSPVTWSYLAWSGGLAVVFFSSAQIKSARPHALPMWHFLALGLLPLHFVLAYLNRWITVGVNALPESFWLGGAMLWAILLTAAAEHRRKSHPLSAEPGGRLHLAAWALVAAGLGLYLPADAWTVGAVGLLIASTLYWRVRELAFHQIAFLGSATLWALSVANSAVNAIIYLTGMNEPLTWTLSPSLLVSLGVSAAAFFILPRLAGRSFTPSRESMVAGMVAFSIALVATYHWIVLEWMIPSGFSPGVIEGGLTTLVAVGVFLGVWRTHQPGPGTMACWVIAGLGGWRIVRFHLFGDGGTGDGLFLNALLLQFGFPLIAALGVIATARRRGWILPLHWGQTAAMILAFLWTTFLSRAFFGAERLFSPLAGNADLYSLSFLWLSLAVLWQSIGLWRRSPVLHVGSLVLLLLTVGKVFFVDAAHLTGLVRVLSFLILGITLIGIGFFYNKVIFGRKTSHNQPQSG